SSHECRSHRARHQGPHRGVVRPGGSRRSCAERPKSADRQRGRPRDARRGQRASSQDSRHRPRNDALKVLLFTYEDITMPDDTQDQQQQQSQGLWPQTIGDPNVDNSEPAQQQEPSPVEKQLAEMREMFERQQQEWQQREERYQQQFDMLLQRSFTPTQAQPPQSAPEVPSLDDLP